MSHMQPEHQKLYGLGGSKRSGKDTVARLYQEMNPDIDVRVFGMSDPLREALYIIDPIVRVPSFFFPMRLGFDGRYKRVSELRPHITSNDEFTTLKLIPDVREFLQKLGTEFGRDVLGLSVWTNVATQTAANHFATGADVVFITGIRYPNEIRMIEDLRGETVYVDRPQEVSSDTHTSETSVEAYDFNKYIENTGTLDDLSKQVARVL